MATRRRYTDEQLYFIYDRTDGFCNICHKKLAFRNYAAFGDKGAWEVDHSLSLKRSGSSTLQNLFPAHISCNRSKQAGSSKAARARAGYGRTPYSPREKAQKKNEAGVAGALAAGATALLAGFSPVGVLLSAASGVLCGRHIARNPKVRRK
jgi:hypothetical protein